MISMDKGMGIKAKGGTVGRYLPVMERCRTKTMEGFQKRFGEMYDRIEPVLMDLADRAPNNRTQTLFFEAIRPLRQGRKQIEEQFRSELRRGFDEFLDGGRISFPFDVGTKGDKLELVEDETFDQFLAVRNMADKCYSEVREEIFALKQRLSMVHGGTKIESKDIPGGPLHTAAAFHGALQPLNLEADLQLILYALFSKFVLGKSEEIYQEFNQLLIEAGIFPNLKFTVEKKADGGSAKKKPTQEAKKAASEGGQGKKAAAAAEEESIGGEELFSSIRNMLAAQRRENPLYRDHPELNPGAIIGEMADAATLVDSIAAVQPQQMASFLPRQHGGEMVARIEVGDAELAQARRALAAEQDQLFRQVDPKSMHLVDLETIELVGMLFEQVLNEQGLPNVTKALISHLHTPYLKVAILDRELLTNSKHDARRLLDSMVAASKKWVDENELRRGVYYSLQAIVDRILTEFKDNLGVFAECLRDLEQRLAELEQRAKLIETRSKDAAMGRDRLETARGRAHQVLEQRIGQRELHRAMHFFLFHVWIDKLTFMLLRDSEIESKQEWRDTIAIVDALLKIHDARSDPRTRARLPEILPNIRKRISDGLEALGDYHKPHVTSLFGLLEAYIAGDAEAKKAVPEGTEAKVEVATTPTIELNQAEVAMVEKLRTLEFGTWFEFLKQQPGRPRHLKLSWYSPMSRKCMFVDSSGIEALVESIEQLARDVCAGHTRVAGEERKGFVERALNAVRKTLEAAIGHRPKVETAG